MTDLRHHATDADTPDDDAELAALEAEAAALEAGAARLRRPGRSRRRLLLLQAPLLVALAVALLVWGRGGGTTATAAPAPAKIGMSAAHLDPPKNAAGPVDAYATIRNTGGSAERLVSVTTPWAATVTLVDKDGKALPWITVPAHGSITLSPTGDHIQLTQLARTPKLHDTVQLDFAFATSATTHVWAPVGPANSITVEQIMDAMKYMDRLPPANAS